MGEMYAQRAHDTSLNQSSGGQEWSESTVSIHQIKQFVLVPAQQKSDLAFYLALERTAFSQVNSLLNYWKYHSSPAITMTKLHDSCSLVSLQGPRPNFHFKKRKDKSDTKLKTTLQMFGRDESSNDTEELEGRSGRNKMNIQETWRNLSKYFTKVQQQLRWWKNFRRWYQLQIFGKQQK